MSSSITTSAGPLAGAAPGLAGSLSLAFAAIVSWLIAEGLGAYMLGSWIASGGPRRQRARPDGMPLAVIFGHAGLAFAGLAGWVSFLITGSAALAWLAIGFLTMAIGLGISTATVWTPYPARRCGAGAELPGGAGDDRPGAHRAGNGRDESGSGSAAAPVLAGETRTDDVRAGASADEMLARALADEALTRRLVDDLLARMLAVPPRAARQSLYRLTPLIPAAHGVMAIATFLLATLAAAGAT